VREGAATLPPAGHRVRSRGQTSCTRCSSQGMELLLEVPHRASRELGIRRQLFGVGAMIEIDESVNKQDRDGGRDRGG